MEALSHGSPIVASRVGWIPEIITDNLSGLLFNSGDVDSLVENITILLENHHLAIELGKNVRAEAQSRFSLTSVASQMKDFYQEVVARYGTISPS